MNPAAGGLALVCAAAFGAAFFVFTRARYKRIAQISEQIDLVLHNTDHLFLSLIHICRRIQKELKQQECGADIPCSVAIGSAWSTSAENLESLVSEADIRMYENKRLMKDTGGTAK